jgi:Flp pilus assembly pilin Flp
MNALQTIRTRLSGLRRDQRGLSTVEYVIILVLIAAVCVATWTAFGKKLKGWLEQGEGAIDTEMQAAPGGGEGAEGE